MIAYYYFIATLPLLSFDKPAVLSMDSFMRNCADHLSPQDLASLSHLLTGSPSPGGPTCDFFRQWQEADTSLKNAIARQRAILLRIDATPYLRGEADMDPSIERKVSDALAKNMPLDTERMLDRLRWATIEDIAGHNPFSFNAILAYALKLRIREKWSTMDKKTGLERIELIANNMLDTETARETTNEAELSTSITHEQE